MSFIKSHPVVAGILGLDIVVLAVASAVAVYRSLQSAQVEILVAPTSAKVVIDGKEYQNGTYNLFPGEYVAEIKADGFEGKERTITLEAGRKTRIYDFLTGKDSDFSYYETSAADMILLQQVGGGDEEVQEFVARQEKKTAIREVLPLTYSVNGNEGGTSISVSVNEGGKECRRGTFCLLILDVFGGNLDKGLDMIKGAGYTPSNFEVLYREGTSEVKEVY